MTTALNPIEAHERTLGQTFSDDYAFAIPPYQRPYAWEEDQVRELLSDLFNALDDTDASGGVYFLGSIVLIKGNAPQAQVVDGQQRLTTLTILLSVLRDLTASKETQIERRSYVFQKASADRGTSDRYRLMLREQDRAFFRNHVQNPGSTDTLPDLSSLDGSQQRIAENARYLRQGLERIPEARRDELMRFIVQRCYLVVVAVPTAEAARRIFTVLNARGMDLTATDILKAQLLERAGPVREADLAKRWEAIESALGRDRFVELFGHIRAIYERDKPRTALDAGFPKFVLPFSGDADEFMSNILEPLADAYTLLCNHFVVKQQFGIEAAKAVRSLERVDNKDWIPTALLRLWKRSLGDGGVVAQFLVDLERLTYFLFVRRADVNERIARFSAVMDEWDPRPDKPAPTVGINLTDNERAEFRVALSEPLYRKSRVCKPVLQRLDEALASGGAVYDDAVSIEHVLPQTIGEGSEWAAHFPDTEQRDHWIHRLANLVLLTRRINTRASNWSFERKKREYFSSNDGSSPFPLTQGVLQTDAWTAAHLKERQEKLLSVLDKLWRLKTVPDVSQAAA